MEGRKEKEMKEDSTRGNAKVMPVNYKGDVLAQAWLDARKLVVISRWLDQEGVVVRHFSELLRIAIDVVVDNLIEKGVVEKVEFTEEARDYLVRRYRSVLNPGGRGKRNVLHNLHLDEIRRKGAYSNEVGKGAMVSEEEVEARRKAEEGAKLFEKMIEEGKFSSENSEEGEKERKQRVYDSIKENFVQDENGVLVPRSSVKVDAIKHKSESEVARDIERRLEEDRQLAEMDMDAPDTGVVEIDD